MNLPQSIQEQIELFAKSLGQVYPSPLTTDDSDAARRIVIALGCDTTATLLAAAYAREFRLALPDFAAELEHPHQATLRMTGRALKGAALVAATAVRRGQAQVDRDEPAEAERSFCWASERFHAIGWLDEEALALSLAGRVAQVHERLDDAQRYYEQARAADREIGHRQDEGVDLGLLAQVAWLREDLDDAERLAQQALRLHGQTRDWHSAATTLTTFGEVARERGKPLRAQLYFLRAKLADHGFA